MNICNSTSWHRINADRNLNVVTRHLWFILNRLNNHFFQNIIDTNLMLREFRCLLDETDWSHFSHKTSPSRLLSDLFWLKLPWQTIQQELGGIKVYDIGCGKGKYGLMLQDLSGNRISFYTGIDVKSQET